MTLAPIKASFGAATGLLLAATMLTAGCAATTDDTPSTGGTTEPTTAQSAPTADQPAPGGRPAADRAVYVEAADHPDRAVLSVGVDGGVGSRPFGAHTGEHELFSLVPLAPGATEYFLRTAVLRNAGEPICLASVDGKVRGVPCDAAAAEQTVRLADGEPSADGQPAFYLYLGESAVHLTDADELVVSGPESVDDVTRFVFVDGGPAEDPFD